MDAQEYHRWYETPRGRWIGRCEVDLLLAALMPRPGESLLDVGCGTGFFTRALANRIGGQVVGVDINPEWLEYARRTGANRVSYAVADARSLPFKSASFDLVVSLSALCFIPQELAAVREMVRVARRRFAIGLLNRRSLLWLEKGIEGGHGGYRGAHWHTVAEAKALFRGLPVQHLRERTAIQVPSGGRFARFLEGIWPSSFPTGGFILVCGDTGPAAPGCRRSGTSRRRGGRRRQVIFGQPLTISLRLQAE